MLGKRRISIFHVSGGTPTTPLPLGHLSIFTQKKTLPFAYIIYSFLWRYNIRYNSVFIERISYIIPLFHCFFADPRRLSQQNYRFLQRRNVTAPNPTPPPYVATFLVQKSICYASLMLTRRKDVLRANIVYYFIELRFLAFRKFQVNIVEQRTRLIWSVCSKSHKW